MTTSLDQLKQTGTVVVSDSGDFECECASSHCELLAHLSILDIQPSMPTSPRLLYSHSPFNLCWLELYRMPQQIPLWSWLLLVRLATAAWSTLPSSTESQRVEVLKIKLTLPLTALYVFTYSTTGSSVKLHSTSSLSLAKKFLLSSPGVFPLRLMPAFHSIRKQQKPRYPALSVA